MNLSEEEDKIIDKEGICILAAVEENIADQRSAYLRKSRHFVDARADIVEKFFKLGKRNHSVFMYRRTG